jgi:hypothetical protein
MKIIVDDEGFRFRVHHLVCNDCDQWARWGWVYGAGKIQLATCNRTACWPQPRDPASSTTKWIRVVEFTPPKQK